MRACVPASCPTLDPASTLGDSSTYSATVKGGAGGVKEIIQIELTAEEQAALNKSAGAVRELVGIPTPTIDTVLSLVALRSATARQQETAS